MKLFNQFNTIKWISLILVLCHLHSLVHAAVFQGKVRSSHDSDNFVFLGKFCFDYTTGDQYHEPGGAVDVEITPIDPSQPVVLNDLQLWMFDDEASSWPALQYRDLSCQERFQRARGAFMVVPDEHQKHLGVWRYNRTFDISQHLRPRHWWFVLASCKGEFSNIKWKLHTYNLHTSPILKEFGVDERHLTIIYRISLIMFIVLLVTHVYGIRRYLGKATGAMTYPNSTSFSSHNTHGDDDTDDVDVDVDLNASRHQTTLTASNLTDSSSTPSVNSAGPAPTYLTYTPHIIQLFTISLILTVVCHWSHFMHSHFFAVDGSGLWWLDRVAGVVDVVARVQLTMVIMLISSGWAVGHNQNDHSRRTILILLGLFGAIYLAMAFIKAVLQDSQYTRVSPTIAVILDLITVGWTLLALWFLRTVLRTYTHETSRAVIAESLFPKADYAQKILNPTAPMVSDYESSTLPLQADALIEAEQTRRRRLYLTLAILYTFWLLCEPLLVVLQQFLRPWTRTEILAAVSAATTFMAYGWFVWAFWPSHDGEYMMLYSSVRIPNANKTLLQDDDDGL